MKYKDKNYSNINILQYMLEEHANNDDYYTKKAFNSPGLAQDLYGIYEDDNEEERKRIRNYVSSILEGFVSSGDLEKDSLKNQYFVLGKAFHTVANYKNETSHRKKTLLRANIALCLSALAIIISLAVKICK